MNRNRRHASIPSSEAVEVDYFGVREYRANPVDHPWICFPCRESTASAGRRPFSNNRELLASDICKTETVHKIAAVERLEETSETIDNTAGELSEEATVLEFEITQETGLVYLEYQPSPSMTSMFDVLAAYSLIVVPPIEYTDNYGKRGIRLTVAGTESAITAISAEVPHGIELHPEQVGEYVPERPGLSGLLTDRQQTVFEVAVEVGYYEVPRETTHEQIATEVYRSPATISEQLQRIESKFLLQYLGD
ncbi:helix-turn-helix domain-containing protein [Haloarcula onubensis]|jgi:predicted DNA binding protein|nr:helix-turn-helix domain-containing protein [Halomicroarcula sp. S3CR25-11]MDS0283786.1 helix-turn-helix domain-containing protein [Halomicroarcula sp. S3CR25-11]